MNKSGHCAFGRRSDVHRRLTLDGEQILANELPNIHPGEVLLEELLVPMGVSQNALACDGRASAAHQRNRMGQARRQRGHGRAASGCAGYQLTILDRPAVRLRSRGSPSPVRHAARPHPDARGLSTPNAFLSHSDGVPGTDIKKGPTPPIAASRTSANRDQSAFLASPGPREGSSRARASASQRKSKETADRPWISACSASPCS